MKKDIHPEYKPVVFKDPSSDFAILTRSTRTSEETIKWEDGNEYPLVTVEISSGSHPFFTGKEQQFAKESRVEKFRRKYGESQTPPEPAKSAEPVKSDAEAEKKAEAPRKEKKEKAQPQQSGQPETKATEAQAEKPAQAEQSPEPAEEKQPAESEEPEKSGQ